MVAMERTLGDVRVFRYDNVISEWNPNGLVYQSILLPTGTLLLLVLSKIRGIEISRDM